MCRARRSPNDGPPRPSRASRCARPRRSRSGQGQDPRGARLAVRARTAGLSATDVDRALTEERSLLITWLNRGTLHLARRLLGWISREEVVGPHKLLVANNGIFRPFALVRGRAVARWGLAGGKLTIEHLGEVKKDAAALEKDAQRVLEFLGF
jgi:DNA glycosylase AlkZ-like